MPLILDESALNGLNPEGDNADTAAGNAAANPNTNSTITLLNANATASKFTPKYFSRELNGNGTKSTGRINAQLGPDNPQLDATCDIATILRKRKTHNDNVTIHDIPVGTMYPPVEIGFIDIMGMKNRTTHHNNPYLMPIVNADKAVMLLNPRNSHGPLHNRGVWATLMPQAIVIRQETSVDIDGKKSNDYTTSVNYRLNLIVTDNYTVHPDDTVELNLTGARTNDALTPGSFQMVVYTWDVKDAINRILPELLTQDHRVDEWLESYSIYDELSELAEKTASDDAIEHLIDILDIYFSVHQSSTAKSAFSTDLARQLAYLESFNLSLEAYSRLYTMLNKHMSVHGDEIKSLIAQNMQLALNDNLHDLNAVKDQLPTTVEDPANPYSMPAYYSAQQRGAIQSTSPLTIVSSGAGTGKSTVILERIKYIEHCGFDPSKINVLSFTNAAADNISEKNPGVRSRTFASQLAEIYNHNFPSHQQSNLDTICNSIAIHYAKELRQQEPIVTTLLRLLTDVAKPGDGSRLALTKLNTFIEFYQRECLDIFDRIKQTSLELQIIICYQLIDQLNEPFPAPEHLIVDEVQDTSVFEFVYILRYVAKHKASLYIVGDSSQTLYEFRAANPKALNSLEASGIFGTHRLTTNYRSNQEILDFANLHLSSIEANAYAKIQLQANALSNVTAQSFQEKITLKHHQTNSLNDLHREIVGVLMEKGTRDYIDGCIARGEQVAFLANTRREATAMHETLVSMYPNLTTMSLMSDRIYSNVLLSRYVQKYWNEVRAVAPKDAPFIFTQQVIAHMRDLVKGNQKYLSQQTGNARVMLSDWWTSNQADLVAMVNAVAAGAMSNDEFFDRMKDNILNYEIKTNNAKQSVIGQRNRARKEQSQSDANFFTSTIHGVKGLEFDNVVLVHRPIEGDNEADKRLYYVALTRAKNTEFIIAVGKSAMPKLVSDYRTIVANLEQAEIDAATAAATNEADDTAISDQINQAAHGDDTIASAVAAGISADSVDPDAVDLNAEAADSEAVDPETAGSEDAGS